MSVQVSSIILAPEVAAEWQPDKAIALLDPNTELPDLPVSQYLNIRCLDTESMMDPWAVRRFQVEAIMDFAKSHAYDSRILVFCNGGISRSTAAGIGILVSRGTAPEDATLAVYKQRPMLAPNKLILKLIDDYLHMGGLLLLKVQETLDTLPKGLYLWCASCKSHFVDGDPNHLCPGWTRT